MLDNFAACFKAVNNPDNDFYTPGEGAIYFYERHVRGEIQVMFSELDLPITSEEILQAISQLIRSDRLLNDFFINGETVLRPYLQYIFHSTISLH